MKATLALAVMALAIIGSTSASPRKEPRKMHHLIEHILKTVPESVIIEEVRKMLDPTRMSSLDDSLKKFLEGLKDKFHDGLPEYGIPPLDPFFLEHFPFNIDQDFAKLSGNLDRANVTEISTYSVDYTKLNVFQLSVAVNFSLPEIRAKGHYDIDGEIVDLLPVYGNGDFHLAVKKFTASVLIKAGTKDSFVFVKELDLDFNIEGLETNFEGLLGGGDQGELANQLISDIAPKVIDAYSMEISSILSDKIIEIANKALDGVTVGDLLDIISGKHLN